MRICLLNSLYSKGAKGGGLYTYMRNIFTALSGLGHDITIVTSGPRDGSYSDGKIKVVQVGEVEPFGSKNLIFNPCFIARRLRYMWCAASYIRHGKFDVIEVSDGGFEQFFLLWKFRVPIVIRMNGTTSYFREVGFKSVIHALEELCFKKSALLISPTDSYAEFIREEFDIKDKRIHVMPNCIDLDIIFNAIDIRRKYHLDNKKVVLTVGTLERRKGTDILVSLAEEMASRPDVVFVLCGEEKEKYDKLHRLDNVILTGPIERDEVYSLLTTCDLVFSPSRLEAGPLNIIEALAFGKPILAANSVGVRDEVEDGRNGFLFDLNDRQMLVDNFLRIIDNENLRAQFGSESKKLSAKYDVMSVVRQIETFYKEVTAIGKDRE